MLYIQSRADMTLGVIEEFYNDTHQMILSSGVSSYTFTVAKNIEDSQYLVEGNYVIITDDQGLGWKFTIMNTTQTHTEITVYCEDIGLELVNKVMDAWNAPNSKQPASYYINKAIKDTKWKIGFNQISNLSRTLKWEGRDTSLNRLLSICTEFDHAEIEFRVKFHNLQVTDYLINIYKSRGANRSDIQLVYGETVNDITKSSSIEELATAMMGVGSDKELPENAPQGAIPDKVTFKNLTYDDGFFFTKMGDPFLRARVANQQFNLREGYIEDYYEYDTSDPQELLNRTITQLKERSEIKVNYEVSAVKFEKSLQLGDTITIIDHDYKPELLLSGRVLELDKSYTDASQDKLVLGNFLILYSNINDKLYNLQNQIKNMKVDSNYMWLRYAIDDKGTGMSATPTAGTKYFAMLVNKKTGVPSDNPADYAGHWKLIQGEDGKDGVAGEKGADGKTSYTHFAYANDVSGHSDFSLDDPTGRAYMGVFSDFTKADSTNPDDYIWSLTKGEDGEQGIQGLQGPQGTKGIAGPKGADGKTQYTHIAYSNSADGKTNFSQTPANHKYIGMYVDFIEDDSNDPTKYGWSLIKGEDGLDGPQGIAGPKGADGKTSYTHIAYANGGETQMNMNKWTLSEPAKKAGAITYKDGTNYIQYKGVANWENYNMQFIAKKGDSISVTVTWTQPAISGHFSFYGATTPQMSVPTGEVGNTGSTALKNKVFKFTFTAGGDNPYFVISGGNVADGVLYPIEVSVQQDFSQSPNDHTYIGMYTDFIEADSDDVSLYNWTQIKGSDGTQGVAGKAGADGKTPYFHSAWANSADGKTGFSTTDSVNKSYLGTYTDFTQADSTDPIKYAWSLIKGKDGTNGTPGKAGADGKTPYFHTAWADSKDGKVNFSTTDPTNRGYLGTYSDFTQADSTDPSKYFWVELVGALSIGGRNYLADTGTAWQARGSGGANQNSLTKWLFTFGTIKQAPFNDGDYVTVSFDYINVGTGAYGTILPQFNNTPWGQLGGGDAMKDNGHVVRTIQWKSGWTSGTATGIQIRMDNVAITRTVTVYNMQFERGNKATDHKAAPEDTQQQIDKVNNGLEHVEGLYNSILTPIASVTAPTNPKNGQQWWVLDANGKTTGFKIWTGSVWKDATIQQSAMNIGTLNGNTINGATINSSNFNVAYDETAESSGRLIGPYFKGTQIIKGGSYLSDYTVKGTTQTGFNHITPDGITNRSNDANGQMVNQATLGRGYLILSEKGKTGVITGDLNAQDSYRNSTDTVAWLGGWGDWGGGNGLIHVIRNGRIVTLSGYPHHNNTTTLGNIFQLPAWAKPVEGVNISAVCYNSSVFNPAACKLFIDKNGLVNITNAQKGGYVVIGASYVAQDM